MTAPTVAIVGGGASGTLAAVHLLRHAQRPVHIVLVERRDAAIGEGVAYATTDPNHLLNVRAGNMSALPDVPGHFASWAHVDGPTFAPRRDYARYLAAALAEAQAEAIPGVVLEVRRDEVQGVATLEPALQLRAGGELRVQRAILALGNFPPRPLRGGTSTILRNNPWAADALDGMSPDDAVLLVGSGLTMVDLVVSLVETRHHQGPIYAVSRRGQLPQIHAELGPTATPIQGDLPTTAAALLRRIRSETAAAPDWRSTIDGLRPVTQATWRAAPLDERARFMRHLQPYWDTHRHRIAPEIGRIMADALQRGQLRTFAGRLVDLTDTTARIRVRRNGELTLEVQRVVNCTGPSTSFEGVDERLLQNLLASQVATLDALRLGFATTADGRLVDSSGQPSSWLFSLGPMRRGELWETVAVPDIRVQAAHLADALIEELSLS